MFTDREITDGASSDSSRQYQADQHFLDERLKRAAAPAGDGEALAGYGDVSLLMRQFYQSPARSAG